ncbi:MAG: DUF4136 domain-containing protein [Gammaproteobacteria bacterium]|nr:DUF4136 domain-containing protein [Gammaproteobacteria bacterium]
MRVGKMFCPLMLLALGLTAACSQGVRYEAHRSAEVEFSTFSTFRLIEHTEDETMRPVYDLAQQEVQRQLRAVLTDKGYREVDSAADFTVDYLLMSTARFQQGGHDRYFMKDRVQLASGTESTMANPIVEGSLHVHFLEGDNGRAIADLTASKLVDSGNVDLDEIAGIVRRMLRDVPAAASKAD